MHPAIPHLIELQRVDHQIAVLRAALDGFPKRIREAEAKLGSARAEVASAKEAHAQAVAERKKFEFDGQQWKDRARKYRDQSGAVKTNEAYKALQHEIANAEARDGQCRGCGMRVLPHILQELRTENNEEVYRCESCGLILYTLEPIPIASPAVGSTGTSSTASTNS